MGAEEFLKIEKTSKDELVGKQEIVIPPETQIEIDELKTTVRTLSRNNAELETNLNNLSRKFDHYASTMDLTPEESSALSEIIGKYLQEKNRIHRDQDRQDQREEAKELTDEDFKHWEKESKKVDK